MSKSIRRPNRKDYDVLLDIIERLVRIEEGLKKVEEHTDTMNHELGECMKDLKVCKDEIAIVKGKFILKISWKQGLAIIGGTTALITLVLKALELLHLFI